MDNNIQDWINKAKNAGLDNNAIISQLQKEGWSAAQIQAAIAGNPLPPQTESSNGQNVTQKNYKKLGTIFIISPFAILFGILILWAIISFFFTTGDTNTDAAPAAIKIIQWLLSFIGMIDVMGILILVPIGIYYLNRKVVVDYSRMDNRSGKNEQSVIPAEIIGWNWGAALLTWIWGIGNSTWKAFWVFVPFVNIFWWVILGIHGNEWAWKARAWESVEQFKAVQRKWSKWGLIIVGGYFAFIVLMILAVVISSR